MNENENRKQPSAAQGVNIFFTLIVIVAVGFFIVKGIQASKSSESEITTETSETVSDMTTEISEPIPSDEELTDSTEGDDVINDAQSIQITKDYFCHSDDFNLTGPHILNNAPNSTSDMCKVSVVKNGQNIISINFDAAYRCSVYFGRPEWKAFSYYDPTLCEEDVFFPENYNLEASIEAGYSLKDLLMLKEMDDTHIVLSSVNLYYSFDEYTKIQTSDGIKYQTSDGNRYSSLLDVPHTIDVEETGEVTTLYSEIEIN